MYEAHYDPDVQALTFVDADDSGTPGAHAVFVCGALQDPTKMAELTGRRPPFQCGAVAGYVRGTEEIDGNEIPLMVPAVPVDDEGPRVLTGVLWIELSDADLAAIESLELAGGYREQIKTEVTVGDETALALTYVKKQP